MPESKSPDCKHHTFSSATFIFLWAPDLNLHGFLMSIFIGNTVWLTNRLRKWTEIYGLKMWHRNVRHPSRTYRPSLEYHVLVLFTVVARVCRNVVMDRQTRIQDGA